MRRRLNNKISIMLIIIVGIFTIFSYLFDQLVIREEDNYRITQIKFENLNTKITKLNSISTQLTTAYDSSILQTINLKRFKNYWLKSILLITNYDELKLNLKDEEIVKSFNDDPKYLDDLVKSRNIEHYRKIVVAINEQVERLHNIYGWNLNFFPQYEDGDYYNGPDIEYSKIFDQNKDIFYEKNFNTYVDLVIDEKKIDNAVKNFKIKNWIDLNKYCSLLLEKLVELSRIPLDDSYIVDDLISKNEELRYQIMDDLRKISSKKNYYILSSIISQIASLLFLLILFRNLIKK
ncbi:hypothetical protein OAY95_02400 [Candidatus Pelagibacter sp.]|nr:hypothetical protein [Candidatus Pelagibacter sp.]